MKKNHRSDNISELASYFEFDGDQGFFEELLTTFPLAFQHILNDIRTKCIKTKSVELPNGEGLLKFSKTKNKIEVHLEKNRQKEPQKKFSQALEQMFKEVCKENSQKPSKKGDKSLIQKSFNKTVLDKVSTLLQEEE